MANNKQFGQTAENLVQKSLQNKGYTFITANFRNKFGEIDLIFQDGDQLVFVEVKARKTAKHGFPVEMVSPQKLHQVRRLGEYFMQTHPDLPQWGRVDVVGVLSQNGLISIEHVQNAG